MTEPDAPSRLAAMRVSYAETGLAEADLASTPLAAFQAWFDDAVAADLPEPNAMVLATAAVREGRAHPSSRTVLLKRVDGRGFVFFSNEDSRKGQELAENPFASLVFPWFPIMRQVVVVGTVTKLAGEESDAYFATRPYGSRIGAAASRQSSVVAGRDEVETAYADLTQAYPDTGRADDVPRPSHWGGFVVSPSTVEFWAGRVSRLHDRLRFVRIADAGALDDETSWRVERLSP